MRSFVPDRARRHLSSRLMSLLSVAPVAALSLTLSSPLYAQAAATGVITGRVQNATNGMYLNNARVSLQGTNRQVFTNQYGEYTLSDVPAGEAKLQVLFTGMEPQTVSVNVASGSTTEQNIRIGGGQAASGDTEDLIQLDQFVVTTQRETNAAAIAANEQRFAQNIKVVVSADAFGDVTEGNIGEFVKYLPGITVDYVAADVRTMSVRGFADTFTNIYSDGVRLASASSGNAQRSFEFEQVSINNVARIEVVKVPTPEYSADALGGSVNMVSKTAFERDRPEFKYRAYVSVNSEDVNFWEKTPGPMKKETYKVLPGFDFDLTLPISKTFGIVVTGLTSNQFNEQHRTQTQWNSAQGAGNGKNAAGAAANPSDPFLQAYTIQDGPKNTFRDSFSIRADWKPAPGHVLFATYQGNYYKSQFGNRNLTWDVGNNGAPTTTGGTRLTWDSEFTEGASGRGSVRHGTSFRDKMGATNAGHFGYRYTGNLWDIGTGIHYSQSKSWYRDTGRGHFSEIRTTLLGTSRVAFADIGETRPGELHAYTASGAELNPFYLANYRIDTVRAQPVDGRDEFQGVYLDIKRDLDFLPFDASLKVGTVIREQDRELTRSDDSWTFVGPDGVANTGDENAAFALDTRYGAYPYWGMESIQWPDAFLLWDRFNSNGSWFQQTTAQQLAAARFKKQNSQVLKETTTAAYVQAEAKFLNNRLSFVTGVRWEKTEDEGRGLLTTGPATTLAQLEQNWKERGLLAEQSYDDFYPSFHANFNITDNLIARFAWAKTYGRPDFSNILPLARVNNTQDVFNDGIGDIPPETIIANNPGLLPWEADNWDLSLEYYIPRGGVLSAGVFRKDLSNFWGTRTGPATLADLDSLNLDSAFVGFDLRTPINVGSARITGAEFNYQQPLTFLSGWGKHFSVFANATKLRLEGSNQADFARFIEDSASFGVTFSRKPLVVMLKWNYRGEQRRGAQTGAQYGANNEFYEYYRPRTFFDVNVEYTISRRYSLFANARNVLNVPQTLERYNAATPDYAQMWNQEKYGVQIALGVKGAF